MLNTSPKIKLHFELPNAGWLPAILWVGEQEFQFWISYTPNSALEEMIAFASAAAQVPFFWHCMWFGEPEEWHFFTEPNENKKQTRFRLEYIDSYNTKTILLELDTPLQTLSLAIWRALRDLESRWESPIHDLEWKSPFPARATH